MSVLARCRDLLSERGSVIVLARNYGGLESRVLGRRWPRLDAPRHLYHFTGAMRGVFEKASLEVSHLDHQTSICESHCRAYSE